MAATILISRVCSPGTISRLLWALTFQFTTLQQHFPGEIAQLAGRHSAHPDEQPAVYGDSAYGAGDILEQLENAGIAGDDEGTAARSGRAGCSPPTAGGIGGMVDGADAVPARSGLGARCRQTYSIVGRVVLCTLAIDLRRLRRASPTVADQEES